MTLDDHPLRLPDRPETLENYRICGHPAKTGYPCGQRANKNPSTGELSPCTRHTPDPERAAKEAARLQDIAEHRKQWEAHAIADSGNALRTDLPEDITPRIFTLIDPKRGRFAVGADDKKNMVKAAPPKRQLLVVWTGQWRSDAFTITAKDAKSKVGIGGRK